MKKRAIKLLALTLVAIMTFFAVGCDMDALFAPLTEIQPEVPSGEWDSPDDTTLVTGDKKETDASKYEPSFIGTVEVGELDFDGAEITILLPDTKEAAQSWYKESPETVLDEFVKMRYSAVTETLNAEILLEFAPGADFASKKANILSMVSQDVESDIHYYDVVSAPADMLADTALRDLLTGINNEDSFPYFDFELPCWNQTLVTECKVNGRLYFMSGATEVSNMLDASVIWHNKTLYDEKKEATDHESMQELALDGLWTYDELYRWSARLSGDTNGVGIEGEGKYPSADAFRDAWDVRFIGEKVTGEFELKDLSADNNRAQNALEMVKALYSANGARLNASAEEFASGKYMFYVGSFDSLKDAPDSVDTFELLPMPKYDTDQPQYKTSVENPMVSAAINHDKSTKRTQGETISAILQLIAEESYMGMFGNFGDHAPIEMNSENNKMIKQIFENMQLTFENMYAPQLAGLDSFWNDALISGGELASAYSSKEADYLAAIEDINRWFGLID